MYPFAPAGDGGYRVRMFGPSIGIAEDPATGGAGAAFAGWLAQRATQRNGTVEVRLQQGIEMRRPSTIELAFDLRAGAVAAVRVGGAAVMVSSGQLLLT